MSRKRDTTREAFWKPHVKAVGGSGLTHAAYCREHKLNVHTLRYWTRILGRPGSSKKARKRSRFVEVTVTDRAVGAHEVELEFPSGVRARLRHEGPVADLADLLRALGTVS
jgi:transposase-like protein